MCPLDRARGASRGGEELGPEPSSSARPPHDFRKRAPQEPPHERSAETSETHKSSGKEPPQEPPHDSGDSPLPLTSTEGSEVTAASEEKLGDVVGKTTAAEPEPEFPELLDLLEPNPFHAERNGRPPVGVERAEGEAGVLADVQALVDAGLADWIEGDEQ